MSLPPIRQKTSSISRQSRLLGLAATLVLQVALFWCTAYLGHQKIDISPNIPSTGIRFAVSEAPSPQRRGAAVASPTTPVRSPSPESPGVRQPMPPAKSAASVKTPPPAAELPVPKPARAIPEASHQRAPERPVLKKKREAPAPPQPPVKKPRKSEPAKTPPKTRAAKKQQADTMPTRAHSMKPAPKPRRKSLPAAAPAPGPSGDTVVPSADAAGDASSASTQAEAASAPAGRSETAHADAMLAALAKLIDRYKSYPRAARRARLEGTVRIEVSIDPGGVIAAFDLVRGSGHRVLDRATLKTFRRISGKKVMSRPMVRPLNVVVPVRYELP